MSNLRQRNIKSALKGSKTADVGEKPSIFQKVRFAAEDVIFNRAMRETNVHRIEQMSVWPYVLTFVVFFTFSMYLVDYLHHMDENTLAYASEEHHFVYRKVPCSKDYDKSFKGCVPKVCGRAVQDDLIEKYEIDILKEMVERVMKYGGGSGGATILDLHSGALSYKDKFVNIYKVTNDAIFSASEINTYVRVKDRIQEAIASTFKIDKSRLFLTKPTFFSRLTNRTAVTSHDEYWHPHIDKVTYGSFYYTSLLYLTTYDEHFTGGRFVFKDKAENMTVEPRVRRLSYFTSGRENEHFVEKVESGTRYAITVSFTCDPKQKIQNPRTRQ